MFHQTSNKATLDSNHYLSNLRKDFSELTAKIARITFSTTFSHTFCLFLLFIEYLQLLSQSIFLIPDLEETDKINVYEGIIYVAKVMDAGTWFKFEEQQLLTIIILGLFANYLILKYLLLLYITIIAKFDIKGYRSIKYIWGLIFKIQGKISCFFITSFCFDIITATSREGFNNLGFEKINLLIVLIIIIVLECIFTFYLQACYCFILPSKSFLSVKTNQVEVFTIVQKIVIQILQVAIAPKLLSTYWILATANLLFSIVRVRLYFTILPLYNWTALMYKAGLVLTVTSLNFSCFFEVILRTVGHEGKVNFILTFWIILTVIMLKISHGNFDRLMMNLISSNKGSPEFLAHRISVIKYLRKQQKFPGKKNEMYERSYLLNAAIDACIESIFNVNLEARDEKEPDIYSKESINSIYLYYLEGLSARFPKNGYLKLYSAYICARKLQYFSAAIKLITNIRRSHSAKIRLNASFLIYEIQKKVSAQSQDKTLDLSGYIQSLSKVAKLKIMMLKQLDSQNKILQEILSETPDLQNIFRHGQAVDLHVKTVQNQIRTTFDSIADPYVEPLMICAFYSLIANHSLTDYSSYHKKYFMKYKKYEKYLTSDILTEENLYQNGNVFVIVSGQKADSGKILFCSKAVEKIYGDNQSSYIGTHISSFGVPSLQDYYVTYFKNLVEKGQKSMVGKIVREFGYNQEGYVREVDFFIDFNPFMTQNFCFNVIIRPISTDKDCIIILENGDIECASKKIGKKLGIIKRKDSQKAHNINIKSVSEELYTANYAFNMIALPEEYYEEGEILSRKSSTRIGYTKKVNSVKKPFNEMSREKAQELYSIYTTKGMSVKLKSMRTSEIYSYQCKVKNIFYDSLLIKVITLDENLDEDELGDLKYDLRDVQRSQNKEKYSEDKTKEAELSENNETKRKSLATDSEEPIPPEENCVDYLKTFETKNPFKGPLSPLTPLTPLSPHTSATQIENLVHTDDHFLTSQQEQKSSIFYKTLLDQGRRVSKSQTPIEKISKSSKSPVKQEERGRVKSFRIERSVATSHWSKSPQQKKISNAIRTALGVRYYSNILRALYFVFYLLLIVIFLCQIILKGESDDTLTFIRSSKDIVNNAEMRNYLLVSCEKYTRLLWDIGQGRLTAKNMQVFPGAPFYISKLNSILVSLRVTNQDLFKSMKSLDEEKTKDIFMKDVRMFETYYDSPIEVFDTYDNFQATTRMVETGLRATNMMLKSIPQAQKEIQFLLRNGANDLLLKNELTSNVLMEAVDSKQQNLSVTINIYLIITMSLLGVLALFFLWSVWKQYQREKLNMLAVIKLDTYQIKETLDKINEFRRVLTDEKSFDEIHNLVTGNSRIKSPRDGYSKDAKKKENLKKPNAKGIRKRYCIYILGLLFFIALFASLTIWYSFSNKNLIDFSQKKQNQFFFINRLKSQISLAATMSPELFSANGTTLTHNEPNLQEFPRAINNLILMKDKITATLMNEDLSYDSKIQDILFNDGCLYVDKAWTMYCTSLRNSGKRLGLVYLITDVLSILQEANIKFQELSNKTYDTLTILEAQTYGLITFPHMVAEAQCDAIANVIGQILVSDVLIMMDRKNMEYGIFVFLFIMLAIITWAIVIRPFRETNNQFKKVLLAFPANLILSSFLLKSFLIKTSKDALNSIKNHI